MFFSKIGYAYANKSKKYKTLNHAFKKNSKKINLNLYGVIKKVHFSVKKC